MNILAYRWNAYNQMDVEKNLAALGHSVEALSTPIKNIEEDMEYCVRLKDRLISGRHAAGGRYDMVFSINYFPVLADACHMAHVPYVCWNCDSPLIAMYHDSIFYETNFVFTFDYSNYAEFKSLGAKHIYHLPLASDADRMWAAIRRSKAARQDCDVSFVGSLYEKNSYDAIASKLPDYLCGYLDGAIEAQLSVSGGNILEKLLTPEICSQIEEITNYQKSPRSFVDIKTLFSTTVLGFKAASLQRKINLSRLSSYLEKNEIDGKKFKLSLFTDGEKPLIPFADWRGKIDYFKETPLVFDKSKINLNMTIPNIKTGVPLRVWDIIGCAGFLVTDFRSELLDYFKPEKDIVIFENSDELNAKVGYYLAHDGARAKIAQSAYKKAAGHTCRHRLKSLFNTLSKEM